MKVLITQGNGWYEGLEGQIFEVVLQGLFSPDELVYVPVEDAKLTTAIRFIRPDNCAIVHDGLVSRSELEALQAELARAREALTAAQAYITALEIMYGVPGVAEREHADYQAALARLSPLETKGKE